MRSFIATLLPAHRRLGALAACFAAAGMASAHAAPKADSSALRRACATGALTAYACAQRGIHVDGAPAPTAPTSTTPPPPASAAPAPAAPAAVARTPPTTPRRGSPSIPAAAPLAPGASVRPFQDTRKRYALEIPDGWDLKMQGGFAAFAHGADWIQLRSAPVSRPDAASAAGMDMLRAEYSQIQTVSDTPVDVGGRPGHRLTLSARSRGGRPSSLVMVAAPMPSGEALVVLAGGAPEETAAIDAGVSALVRSLRFR